MICRDGSVGAAVQTAPTNGYEPSLKIDSVVVNHKYILVMLNNNLTYMSFGYLVCMVIWCRGVSTGKFWRAI